MRISDLLHMPYQNQTASSEEQGHLMRTRPQNLFPSYRAPFDVREHLIIARRLTSQSSITVGTEDRCLSAPRGGPSSAVIAFTARSVNLGSLDRNATEPSNVQRSNANTILRSAPPQLGTTLNRRPPPTDRIRDTYHSHGPRTKRRYANNSSPPPHLGTRWRAISTAMSTTVPAHTGR